MIFVIARFVEVRRIGQQQGIFPDEIALIFRVLAPEVVVRLGYESVAHYLIKTFQKGSISIIKLKAKVECPNTSRI